MAAKPPLDVPACKAELLRRMAKSKLGSLSPLIKVGATADHVIEQAFRELRDEGRFFSQSKRWYPR
jgi:hypothetical protein